MDRRTFLFQAAAAVAGASELALGYGPALGVVTLSGSPRERGRIHGESLRKKIRDLSAIWKEHLGRPKDLSPDAYIERFLADTAFESAMRRWTPDLLEEIRGIAEGSGLPYETALAMQLVDEEWWYSITRDLAPEESTKGEKCTVVGASRSAGAPSLVAQNLDIPGFYDGFMTILRVKSAGSDLEAMVVTAAGLVAMNGVNSRGVAVCVNALLELADATDGLPVACVIRGLLARESLSEAERFVREVRHASGQAYAIGSPEKVVCYEASGGRVAPFAPEASRLVHTNHCLANDDLSPLGLLVKEGKIDPPGPKNSRERYRAAEARIAAPGKSADVATVKAALGSHDSEKDPVCRHFTGPDGGFTAACTIYVLESQNVGPRLLLAENPSCSAPFAEHRF